MAADDPHTREPAAFEPAPDDPLARALAWRRLAAALFAGADPPPPRLGAFEVVDVLGRGAMGTVYLARDAALAREVAIKVLHARDPAARERTIREARAIARVAHPALVAVHAIGEHDGQVHVVMERVRGEPLALWQACEGRAWREVLAVYLQVGRGLQALHDAGLVHRDIKPDNVLVEADGRARIVDLGLARGVGLVAVDVAGTPLYMAPEQRAGAAGPASDQFALCVALFEALYHRRPFVGADASTLAAAIATGAIVTPPPGPVPERVRGAVVRGLQADPARRWPSLRALVDALEAAVATTRGQRDRQVVLARTAAAWIDGVLARSLAEAVAPGPSLRVDGEPAEHGAARLSGLLARGRSLAIVGAAGAGKTTLLLELARDALRRAEADPTQPLPIVLQLASWAGQPLAAWLVDEVRDRLGVPRRCTRAWLADDGLVLLLDGLDRVAPARRPACVAAIRELRRDRLVAVVVTCRDDVAGPPAALGLDVAVALEPLDPDRVRDGLVRAGPEHRGLVHALATDAALRASLRTPLLVDVAARTFRGRAAAELTGTTSAALLRRELWASYLRRTAEAGEHAPAELAALAFVAAQMEREGRDALYLEQLQPTWLEGQAMRGLHVGLTLLLVATAAAAVVGPPIGLAGGAAVGLTTALLVGPTLALFVGASVGVRAIRPVERLAWSTRELRRGAAAAVIRGLALAALMAAIATLVWGAGGPPSFAAEVLVANLVVHGLLFCLALAVVAGLRGEAVEVRLAPNQGIRTSARNAVIVAAAVAVATAAPLLGLTVLLGPPPAPALADPAARAATWMWRAHPLAFFALIELCTALTLGLFAGLHRGGLAVISHGVLRLLLAAGGRLPLRLAPALERASARALLRRTGGGWIFSHDELREHLAAEHRRGKQPPK